MDESFDREVYSVVKEIPYGHVLTYGQIARLVGKPNHARRVGRAMKSVSRQYCLPCHRVVNSEGRTAPHWPEQKQLLEQEGVTFRRNGYVNIEKHVWKEAVT